MRADFLDATIIKYQIHHVIKENLVQTTIFGDFESIACGEKVKNIEDQGETLR